MMMSHFSVKGSPAVGQSDQSSVGQGRKPLMESPGKKRGRPPIVRERKFAGAKTEIQVHLVLFSFT